MEAIFDAIVPMLTGWDVTRGGVPLSIAWAKVSNVTTWWASGRTGFTFAGHPPPGVDEGELLTFLVIGMAIFTVQVVAEARRTCR